MKILTVENQSFDIDNLPDEIDDIRYCVLNCSNSKEIDFYFIPLVFLESYNSPAVVLQIGQYSIKMPLDWSILVCDEEYTALEVIPLTSLNDRGFHVPVFNPIKHMFPTPQEVSITNIYNDIKWFFPKLKPGNVLVIPVEDGPTPNCVMFVKDVNKSLENIDIAEIFS